jgi:hypothetical protein
MKPKYRHIPITKWVVPYDSLPDCLDRYGYPKAMSHMTISGTRFYILGEDNINREFTLVESSNLAYDDIEKWKHKRIRL